MSELLPAPTPLSSVEEIRRGDRAADALARGARRAWERMEADADAGRCCRTTARVAWQRISQALRLVDLGQMTLTDASWLILRAELMASDAEALAVPQNAQPAGPSAEDADEDADAVPF